MDINEIEKAAEENAKNYCIQRGLAKQAFKEGVLWALQHCREVLVDAKSCLDNSEFDYGHNINHKCDDES